MSLDFFAANILLVWCVIMLNDYSQTTYCFELKLSFEHVNNNNEFFIYVINVSKVCNVCNLKAIDDLDSFRNQVGLSTLHILGTTGCLISCINIIVRLVSCLQCRGLRKCIYTKKNEQ